MRGRPPSLDARRCERVALGLLLMVTGPSVSGLFAQVEPLPSGNDSELAPSQRHEEGSAEPTRSLRTWELVRRDCRTTATRQEVTLFANGTLRLRTIAGDRDELRLAELTPDEVEAYVNRLSAEDLSEVAEGREGVLGAHVERCGLYLELPDRPEQRYYFGRFDSLPLALSRLNAIVNDMVEQVQELAPESRLPRDYFPEPGDILQHVDGRRYRVVALTSDRKGVEIVALEEPLTVFVPLEEIRHQFVELVERPTFP